jgi:hypothetical protein
VSKRIRAALRHPNGPAFDTTARRMRSPFGSADSSRQAASLHGKVTGGHRRAATRLENYPQGRSASAAAHPKNVAACPNAGRASRCAGRSIHQPEGHDPGGSCPLLLMVIAVATPCLHAVSRTAGTAVPACRRAGRVSSHGRSKRGHGRDPSPPCGLCRASRRRGSRPSGFSEVAGIRFFNRPNHPTFTPPPAAPNRSAACSAGERTFRVPMAQTW